MIDLRRRRYFRLSLQQRVALAFALLGALLSLALGGAFFSLALHFERQLVEQTLAAEAGNFLDQLAEDPGVLPPSGHQLQIYLLDQPARSAPAALLPLPPGLHELRLADGEYFAELSETGGTRLAVLLRAEQLHLREQQFGRILALAVVFSALLGWAVGYWLAGRVIVPVRQLAQRVRDSGSVAEPLPMAAEFARDEVGELARAFDHYQRRLHDFLRREQAFTADASHELRTPLAVIEGATEVLLADRTLNDKQRGRLQRVQRAVQEAGELVTALLALAREQAGQAVAREPVPLADLLESLIDSHRYLLARKPVKVLLQVEAEAQVDCVPALLRAVLGNLLRNAFSYTREGEVRVVLRADSVSISDSGPGIDTALLPEVFERHARGPQGGEGIGLSLVQRICEREGWRVLMRSSGVGQGTLARVAFAADMTSASHGANESLTRC